VFIYQLQDWLSALNLQLIGKVRWPKTGVSPLCHVSNTIMHVYWRRNLSLWDGPSYATFGN